jgi:DNA-directed RNA polymerase specialized sigma24 family protein
LEIDKDRDRSRTPSWTSVERFEPPGDAAIDAAALVRDDDLVALDEALSRLDQIDPRAGRVVELRFFGGLSEREAADAIGISLSTLRRDWNFAKAWLFDQLSPR